MKNPGWGRGRGGRIAGRVLVSGAPALSLQRLTHFPPSQRGRGRPKGLRQTKWPRQEHRSEGRGDPVQGRVEEGTDLRIDLPALQTDSGLASPTATNTSVTGRGRRAEGARARGHGTPGQRWPEVARPGGA